MNMVTVGIDLAKNVFALHGVDQSGKAVFIKPKVARLVQHPFCKFFGCLFCASVLAGAMRERSARSAASTDIFHLRKDGLK